MRNLTLVYSVHPHSHTRLNSIRTLDLYTMVRDPMNVNLAIRNSHDVLIFISILNQFIVERNLIYVNSVIINPIENIILNWIRVCMRK